jgi:hypothetical protein
VTTTDPVEKVLEAHDLAIVGSYYLPDGRFLNISSSYPEDANAPVAQPWQIAAWRVWHCVGEIKAPTSYLARVVSRRVDWRVFEPLNAEDPLDQEGSHAVLQEAFGASSVDDLVRLMVLNVEIAGEFYIVRDTDDEDDRPRWSVYSVVEPKLKEKIEAAEKAGRPFYRVWVADPTNVRFADAATSGILDSAYDLMELTALSRAQSRSRIASAGMLLVPTEQKFGEGDPFGSGLEEAMTRPIEDVSSATAVTPIKVDMAGELIEKVRHVTFDRPFDERIPEKIERATRRIALGMDYPPEVLLGFSDSSHWNAWATQEETWRGSLAPLAEMVANVLAWVVRTELEREVGIVPDPTELLARRATPQDSINAFMVGAVSREYVRKALGADESDAPTAEDLDVLRQILSPGSASTAEQSTTATTSPPNQGVEPR